jgi:DNA-binding NarL/FixJ family response regulator
MTRLVVLNVNRMYVAALAPALERRGFDVLMMPQLAPDVRYVEVVHCAADDDGASWTRLKRNEDLNRAGYVAIVDAATIDSYRRAFRLGAAVVTPDAEPDAAADIIIARYSGEISVPAGLLVALLRGPSDELSDQEREVFRQANQGKTLAQIAESTHYSERHVRRLLHAVLEKAGTRSREVAAGYFDGEL